MWSTFSVGRRRVGVVAVVEVEGELDVLAIDEFRECAVAAIGSSRVVVVDLSGTTFLDCAGLSTLLAVQREARTPGGTLTVAGVGGLVGVVLDAFGVRAVLEDGRSHADRPARAGTGGPRPPRVVRDLAPRPRPTTVRAR